MDNSKYGIPSQEWHDYDAAHPDLHINDDGMNDNFTSPAAFRDEINAQRLAASRAGMEAMGMREKVLIQEHQVPTRDGATIPLRAYRPRLADTDASSPAPAPAYLYFHGGGMMFGTAEGEDFACSTTALGVSAGLAGPSQDFVVLSVCYRHTPDVSFPTFVHDAWDAFEWVVEHAATLGVDPSRLVVGGISAGGCLTASVVFTEVALAKKEGRPLRLRGQLLAIPWLIMRDAYPFEMFAAREKASIVQCKEAAILPHFRYNLFTDLCKIPDAREPIMNVGLAGDDELEGMPRTAVVANGWDLLRDEAFVFADKLERLGIPTKKHLFPGLPHAFRRWPDLPSSKRWDQVTFESIRWILDDDAPVDEKGTWNIEVPEEHREANAHYFT